jgi:TorA maturation chaperone TorD
MMATPTELQDLAEIRSRTWWLLSRFYLERPEPSFLAELTAAFGSTPDEDAAPDAWVKTLVACLASAPPTDLSRRLRVEFTRLFRGIQEGQGPPPPYESLYRGQSVGGDLTLSVRNRYRAAGFNEIEPSVGPQDHLGAELRFLALLALREAQAWECADSDAAQARIVQQQGFLETHLLTWLPDYVVRIQTESPEPFYSAAAGLTLAFAADARADLDLIDACSYAD